MAGDLGDIAAAEQATSGALAETARQIAASVLSTTFIAASQAALRAVAPNLGRGAIREAAADLRRLRTDAAVSSALANDLRVAQGQAALLFADALWLGYRDGAEHRAKAWSTDQMRIVSTPTPDDRAGLAFYPVHGLTTAEHARGVALRLDEYLAQALAQPLTGAIDPSAIPAAFAVVVQAHAEPVANLVDECYHLGVQAAVRAVGDALTGAA